MAKKKEERRTSALSDVDELIEDLYILETCINACVDGDGEDKYNSNGLHYQWERFKRSVDRAMKPRQDGATVSLVDA